MKKLAIFLILISATVCRADVKQIIRDCSWTVVVRNVDDDAIQTRGSCTVMSDSNDTFALTAGHVVDKVDKKLKVTICRPIRQGVERIGTASYDCEIVKISKEHDVALMKVKKKDLGKPVVFGEDTVTLDTLIYHCGTFNGLYDQSLVSGRVIGHDYKFDVESKSSDQAEFALQRGSSGGGVFNESGQLVGVATWMHGANNGFYTPLRGIRPWLKEIGYEHLYDPKKEGLRGTVK